MLVVRSLRVLTKVTQNCITATHSAHIKRELRRLPRSRIEFQALNLPASEQEEPHVAAATHEELDVQKITTHNSKDHNDRLPSKHDEIEHLPSTESASRDYAPTFNLAAYVNKSPTLQQLIKLGVDLNSIERRKGLAEFVLRLNFDENVKPYLLFLQDQGVPAEAYGELITKNPLLFKVDLDDLQTRVNYLEAKRFTLKQRQRIFTLNPYWLMFSTRRIDRRLGHFQREFHLSGDDVRFLASKQPRLITYNMEHIRKATFCIREEMGFDEDELRCLLLSKPRLWMMAPDELVERFAYAHKQMQLTHDMLIQFPEVLTSREFRLRQRHEFLKMLGRAQYNPNEDLYISPKAVVEGNDYQFVRHVAKSDMQTYEMFLKTL